MTPGPKKVLILWLVHKPYLLWGNSVAAVQHLRFHLVCHACSRQIYDEMTGRLCCAVDYKLAQCQLIYKLWIASNSITIHFRCRIMTLGQVYLCLTIVVIGFWKLLQVVCAIVIYFFWKLMTPKTFIFVFQYRCCSGMVCSWAQQSKLKLADRWLIRPPTVLLSDGTI